MATVAMEKLLSTVIQLKASDVHISVGQPPVVRHHGRMRKLDAKILDSDDTAGLMKSITPDRCQQELQQKGGADFAIEYTDGVRFRVAVFKQRGSIGMVMPRGWWQEGVVKMSRGVATGGARFQPASFTSSGLSFAPAERKAAPAP